MASCSYDINATDIQKKTERMKKVHYAREWEQMKLQRHGAERERLIFMFERHDKQFSMMEEIEKTLNNELKSERMKLEQQLKKIKGKVCRFQQELKSVKATPEFVNKLKETMEDIESAIREFKEKQRETLEVLTLSEKETEQEIKILENRINSINENPVSGKQPKGKVKSFQADLPKEIQAFETFVAQNGGLQGGWDDYDHGAFLRIRNRHKGHHSFISAAVRQIPGRNQEDIERHEGWYSEFLELKQRKMEVIALWRRRKEEKENLATQDNSFTDDDDAKKEREAIIKKKLLEERKAKKEQVLAWKARKQEEKHLEEQRKWEEELIKKEMEEKRRKEKKIEIDEIHVKLKAKREVEERLQWMQELEEDNLKREQQQEIRENLSRFQERDRVAMNIKKREQQRKQEMDIIKKEHLESTKEKVQVERDRSRLYQLTEGWVNRKQDKSTHVQSQQHMKLPHRAVPAWRKNL